MNKKFSRLSLSAAITATIFMIWINVANPIVQPQTPADDSPISAQTDDDDPLNSADFMLSEKNPEKPQFITSPPPIKIQ